jgi:hypothetical protein
MQSSHILWKWKRHACTDFGRQRGEAIKKKKWFWNTYCRNQGGMCYRHNLAGPEGGPRARWAQRIIVVGL